MEVHLEACHKLPSTSASEHCPGPSSSSPQPNTSAVLSLLLPTTTSIDPGPWKETTGLEIEGFPRQLYGNDCGIFMLMYALYTILDAPYDFTIIDMPALRRWWCVMLMENFDLGSHGKMFAHWTETSKALLRGEVPPVFRVRKKKVDDITELEEQLQPHPADVSVGKDVEKTMEA
ncbi:hypothetical protein JOQ06_003176 [Pogonophryne albipinna]|uniref:Ubiquitin-like protease family profile domain-containing protein n=1 Tax=Pogonophryne albipinna TaxID=1090488 RepID=A0AAD6FKR0_9TELE|nr:hypothetical protein JOQ06_003176 [Pogonophryne albipinna]